ncbi:Uncharacterised protein [Mycobacteroides abscessus subsp. abscessus]|nr:Uncharacterised protein [Mycobacteroides abscessus subsp. abscessus]
MSTPSPPRTSAPTRRARCCTTATTRPGGTRPGSRRSASRWVWAATACPSGCSWPPGVATTGACSTSRSSWKHTWPSTLSGPTWSWRSPRRPWRSRTRTTAPPSRPPIVIWRASCAPNSAPCSPRTASWVRSFPRRPARRGVAGSPIRSMAPSHSSTACRCGRSCWPTSPATASSSAPSPVPHPGRWSTPNGARAASTRPDDACAPRGRRTWTAPT